MRNSSIFLYVQSSFYHICTFEKFSWDLDRLGQMANTESGFGNVESTMTSLQKVNGAPFWSRLDGSSVFHHLRPLPPRDLQWGIKKIDLSKPDALKNLQTCQSGVFLRS